MKDFPMPELPKFSTLENLQLQGGEKNIRQMVSFMTVVPLFFNIIVTYG